MSRTFQDIIDALLNDETWEIPEEERPMMVEGLDRLLLDL